MFKTNKQTKKSREKNNIRCFAYIYIHTIMYVSCEQHKLYCFYTKVLSMLINQLGVANNSFKNTLIMCRACNNKSLAQ